MAYNSKPKLALGTSLFVIVVAVLSGYFAFAAVQGDFGHFRRAQIEAEEQALKLQLASLKAEHAVIANKAKRLSDSYLDLDLLDEQARRVLGLARGDEIIIR